LLDAALDPDQTLFRMLKGTVSLAYAITAAPQHRKKAFSKIRLLLYVFFKKALAD
jgi:hypothetical protein